MIKIGDLKIFTIKEVASLFGLRDASLRRYIREGKLTGQKMGQQWYISERALDEFFVQPYQKPVREKEKKPKEK
jgi:excisionase family DNA binding protein